MAKEADYFPWKTYNNVTMKRLFSKITDIGTNALEDKDQLKQVRSYICYLTTTFEVCPISWHFQRRNFYPFPDDKNLTMSN